MAIYHLSAQIIGRSGGKSTVASSAYRAGEKIHDKHIGQTFDYTKKRGVDYTEILTPSNAPEWASDRSKLWNEVEKIEKSKNSQLSRELNIALPKELAMNQQIELIRNFAKEQFVDKGMVADIAMHNLAGENPHAHVMLTVRPFNENKTWGAKSKKEYILDQNGKKIKLKSGEYKSIKIDTTDWNNRELLKDWRKEWAVETNKALEKAGAQERIDHRSLTEQGIKDRLPQIHVGVHANAMEKRGIQTERGDHNRAILEINADAKQYDKDEAVCRQAEKQYQAKVKAKEANAIKAQVSVPISEPTRPPIIQQPQTKTLEPVRKEVQPSEKPTIKERMAAAKEASRERSAGISTLTIDEWKREISQVKEGETAKVEQTQAQTFEEIKTNLQQARTKLGRLQETIDRIDSQLRSEIFELEKYKNYDTRISEVEERLGQLSRLKPWQWNEIKTLEQSKANLTKSKQTDFGETRREHIEQHITQLNQKRQSEKNKLPELNTRYKQTKDAYDQRLTELKALSRQKDLDKSKDLLKLYKDGEKLTTQETKLINSFSNELNIKKIPIRDRDKER